MERPVQQPPKSGFDRPSADYPGIVRLAIALVVTVLLWYQMTYLLTGIGWALTHAGRVSTPFVVIPPAVLAMLWGGWFLSRRLSPKIRTPGFLVFTLMLLGAVELALPQTPLRAAREARAARGAEVSGLADEPFLSPRGNPIGIRVRYEVTFPVSGVYSVSPSLSRSGAVAGRAMDAATQLTHGLETIQPPPSRTSEPGQRLFQGGVAYRFAFDFLPSFLFYEQRRESLCVQFQPHRDYSADELVSAVQTAVPFTYRVVLQVSARGGGGRFAAAEHETARPYAVRDFYESAVREGSPVCDFGATRTAR